MEIFGRIRPIERIRRILPCALLLFAARPALAHDQWIDAADFYPVAGETVEVYVCGGHYFPESSFAVKDDVLEGFWVSKPGSGRAAIETRIEDKERVGRLAVDREGVYVLGMVLKRPRAKEPAFEAKCLVVVNPAGDAAARYLVGNGLELVPGKPVSELRAGDELPVLLVMDGAPISGSLTVVPADGKTAYLKAEPDRPAPVPIRKSGKYLVAAEVDGRACSLVFDVRRTEPGEKE